MIATIRQVYRIVLGYWPLVFRFAGVLVPAFFLAQLAAAWWSWTTGGIAAGGGNAALSALVGVLTLWTLTVHSVRWHRFTLLQEIRAGALDVAMTRREWGFLGRAILVALVVAAAAVPVTGALFVALVDLPPGATPEALADLPEGELARWIVATLVATDLVAALLLGRLGLVLPAAALDRPLRLADSWAATRGRTLPAAALVVAALAPGLVLNLIVMALPAPLPGGVLVSSALVALSVAVTFVTYALLACALAHLYAFAFGWPSNAVAER